MKDPGVPSILLACGACALLAAVVEAARTAASRHASEPTRFGHTPGLVTRSGALRNRAPGAGERAEALSRRKQDFLGLLSHELRNPLSAINGALAVMRTRPGVQAGQQARTVVERQVAHIARLVEDLVDTARVERGTLSLELEPVDLRDVLATAVEMAQPSVSHRRQTFICSSWNEPMLVNGDRVRLQQVFSNLLLNASKYTPERGEIELRTDREGPDFRVSVRDTGRGIAEADLSKVFEPFVRATRDVPGLGVGLYVARTLVEQHGGEIDVESGGADAGATFTVRLPELSPLLRRLS